MTRRDTTFEVADRVATLTLARPEIRNAITGEAMLEEVISAFEEADRRDDVTVLVVAAQGPAFSAGGNVKDMRTRSGLFAGSPDQIAEGYRRSIQRLTRTLLSVDVATVAAVNGPAIGAGFDLVLGCDLRIGTPEARFAHTFVDLGIIPGDGGAWLLPRVVGWQRASELAFTARSVDADEAVAMGILLEVVPADELTGRVAELARTIASKPPHSVRLAKRLLRHARTMDLEGFLDLSAGYQAIAHHTEDHGEAMEAFFARRPGRFRGR